MGSTMTVLYNKSIFLVHMYVYISYILLSGSGPRRQHTLRPRIQRREGAAGAAAHRHVLLNAYVSSARQIAPLGQRGGARGPPRGRPPRWPVAPQRKMTRRRPAADRATLAVRAEARLIWACQGVEEPHPVSSWRISEGARAREADGSRNRGRTGDAR